jgi:hypothetical protein
VWQYLFQIDHEIYHLRNGLVMPTKNRIYNERTAKSACMLAKNLFRSVLNDEALLWCTMDGAQKGGRLKIGALPAVHSHIKEAIWRKLSLK